MKISELSPAITWFGGKWLHAEWIIEKLPPHKIYVEVFGGAASILCKKPPSEGEVYNDINEDLVRFWRVIRDPEMFARFQLRVALTPYARAEYHWVKQNYKKATDQVERAARWWTLARLSFSGHVGHSFGFNLTQTADNKLGNVSAYLSAIKCLPFYHERFKSVQIDNDDWKAILERYDGPDVLFYLDPPYETSTRSSGEYDHELSVHQHFELVKAILKLKGAVVLSGYNTHVYQPLVEAGWIVHNKEIVLRAVGRTRDLKVKNKTIGQQDKYHRTETLWIKPHVVVNRPTLFDDL